MILLAVFWENPAVVGLILALPATALGYLGYQRSRVVDEKTSESTSIGLAVDALTKALSILQEDNRVLREDVVALRKLKTLIAEVEKVNGV